METLRQKVQPHEQQQVMVNSFIQSVYGWMAAGLGITAVFAFFVASNEALFKIIYPMRFILFIGELALVFMLAARIDKISSSTATAMFLFYSALNGATLSAIFYVYSPSAIFSTFLICAGTFAACSIYGMATKRDLTSMGGFMFMGLIGIIIATLINFFIQSSAMAAIISYIGVFIFIGLTAYDTQKIKMMALTQPHDLEAGVVRKGAIMGALALYLDFINLFLFFLQIFGGSRD